MTFQRLLEEITNKRIQLKEVKELLEERDHWRTINYFIHHDEISREPLSDAELSQLQAIVDILQILYNSDVDSPITDQDYDVLQEMLVNMGIPRLTGSIEINDAAKASHRYTILRGTLDKVYYLTRDENRINKSRKYLDEWIRSTEAEYEKKAGKPIDLNNETVCLQCKMDGASVVLDVGESMVWLTRGDTKSNRASDVSHIMNIFNDLYHDEKDVGIKFELMCTEENRDKINQLIAEKPYKNSRQIVIATLNNSEQDVKAQYLYPVPLRIVHKGEDVEQIHPLYMEKFPYEICKLGDRDTIRAFANKHRVANINGMRFRTDGCVITILNKEVQRILGREDDINHYEVAYKFTEETATSKIVGVEFETSVFGYITPVAVFYPVILKGNTVDHASLSTRERFDELDLHIGDEVNVLYDIIPYVTKRSTGNGRKINFVRFCPSCGHELDLSEIRVRCQNEECPSRVLGRILNFCTNLRIQNIGYQTLETLQKNGFLDKGIRSLYKLKKKVFDIEMLDGFGRLKTRKIVAEIEAKRKLKDYELFGSLGIAGISMKTFQAIFQQVRYNSFLDMIQGKKLDQIRMVLQMANGVAENKAKMVVEYFDDIVHRKEILKLAKELTVEETYGASKTKGKIVFSGFRSDSLEKELESRGYEISNSVSKNTSYLVVKDTNGVNSKIAKAKSLGIPIISFEDMSNNIASY